MQESRYYGVVWNHIEDTPPITNDGIYNIQVVGNICENPELLEMKK